MQNLSSNSSPSSSKSRVPASVLIPLSTSLLASSAAMSPLRNAAVGFAASPLVQSPAQCSSPIARGDDKSDGSNAGDRHQRPFSPLPNAAASAAATRTALFKPAAASKPRQEEQPAKVPAKDLGPLGEGVKAAVIAAAAGAPSREEREEGARAAGAPADKEAAGEEGAEEPPPNSAAAAAAAPCCAALALAAASA